MGREACTLHKGQPKGASGCLECGTAAWPPYTFTRKRGSKLCKGQSEKGRRVSHLPVSQVALPHACEERQIRAHTVAGERSERHQIGLLTLHCELPASTAVYVLQFERSRSCSVAQRHRNLGRGHMQVTCRSHAGHMHVILVSYAQGPTPSAHLRVLTL